MTGYTRIAQHTATEGKLGLSETIRLFEELSFNAWPALQTIHYDGWILRLANGYTKRANSVNPIYTSHEEVQRKIVTCEGIYRKRGQSTVFKMTDAAHPDDLDALLDAQGYRREAPTSVQTLDLSDVHEPASSATSIDADLSDTWLEAFCRLNTIDPRHVSTMRQMLDNIVPARCFATLHHENEVAAVGMAVFERGFVGLYDIVTAPQLRQQGFGTQLVLHLLKWGKSKGAVTAYLQVVVENLPALNLYCKLGFCEAYRYWYRIKATDG